VVGIGIGVEIGFRKTDPDSDTDHDPDERLGFAKSSPAKKPNKAPPVTGYSIQHGWWQSCPVTHPVNWSKHKFQKAVHDYVHVNADVYEKTQPLAIVYVVVYVHVVVGVDVDGFYRFNNDPAR
jgi:hypothetical protein